MKFHAFKFYDTIIVSSFISKGSIKGYLKITNEFSVGKWKVISVQRKFIFIAMNYYIQFQSLIKCFKVISYLPFEGFAV